MNATLQTRQHDTKRPAPTDGRRPPRHYRCQSSQQEDRGKLRSSVQETGSTPQPLDRVVQRTDASPGPVTGRSAFALRPRVEAERDRGIGVGAVSVTAGGLTSEPIGHLRASTEQKCQPPPIEGTSACTLTATTPHARHERSTPKPMDAATSSRAVTPGERPRRRTRRRDEAADPNQQQERIGNGEKKSQTAGME